MFMRGPRHVEVWLSLLMMVVGNASSSAGQMIVCEPASVDFGRFHLASYTSASVVKVHNLGDVGVGIKSVDAGCGCLHAAILDSSRIGPGEMCHVELRLDGGRAKKGKQQYTLSILLEGTDAPSAMVPLFYEYAPHIEVLGRSFSFEGRIAGGAATGISVGSVRLINHWSERLSIEKVTVSNPQIAYTIADTRITRSCASCNTLRHFITLTAELPREWPPGPVSEQLIIRTNHPDYPEITCPISGTVHGPVVVSPDIVLLGAVTPGTSFSRRIKLKCKEEVAWDAVTASCPWITVSKCKPTGHDEALALEVCGQVPDRPGLNDGTLKESLTLSFIRPLKYDQIVPIVGRIRDIGEGSATR